jgi:hypothetical protein
MRKSSATVVTGAVWTAAALMTATVVAAPAAVAATGDRPTGVASVQAEKHVTASADGTTLTVVERISCQPGWEPAELDAFVTQDNTSEASGFVIPTIPCDGREHRVEMTVPVGAGPFSPFQRGPVTISSQFLVTNVESGDSAGAHDVRTGRLHVAR